MSIPKDLVVLGGGGHAGVVIQAAQSRPKEWNVVGFVDPSAGDATAGRLGVQHLGEDDIKIAGDPAFRNCSFVLGLGSTFEARARREVVSRTRLAPERWATVLHAGAWVAPSAVLGPGTVVLATAVVNPGAVVGAHGIVNTGAIVEYDAALGAYVHAAPAAVVGARTKIGDGAYLGMGCRIRERLSLGANVRVGMGAVVLRSVAEGRVVIGVPAKDMAPADER
jgi:sugar O-acyltransferase (sialic acid O-acetyltransferase NeuD family)